MQLTITNRWGRTSTQIYEFDLVGETRSKLNASACLILNQFKNRPPENRRSISYKGKCAFNIWHEVKALRFATEVSSIGVLRDN